MATLTSDRYLDAAACTAGEAFTLNGARLTVRTDTRWHANSPASMTGSLGAVTISATLGGGYTIDGTKVRWMAYDGGSGTVPAIGTTVSGGTSGASGYLLGVWSAPNAAPTAVGAAMPATGYLKFREVTGAFVDNDVLSDMDHNLTITGNLFVDGGGVPVVATADVHQVNVNYTVPVQAQGIATSGSTGPTASDIAAAILAAAQITPIHSDLRNIKGLPLSGNGVTGDEFHV